MNNFTKYLTNYAEDEVNLLATFPQHNRYSHTLIIPAYKENPNFIDSFIQSSLVDQNVLLIIVINQPEYETNSQVQTSLFQYGLNKPNLKSTMEVFVSLIEADFFAATKES